MKKLIALFIVATLASAQAVTVRTTLSKGDPCWMTTGCKFATAFENGCGSLGIWVKNITESASPAMLFGNGHVNAGFNIEGVSFLIQGDNIAFRVQGKEGSGNNKQTTIYGNDTTKALLTDDAWHFFVGSFDFSAGTITLWIDGVLFSSIATTVKSVTPQRNLTIAGIGTDTEGATTKDAYAAGFKGLYADASIWNKALSASEVSALYAKRAPYDSEGLVGYWPLADDACDYALNAIKRGDGTIPDGFVYNEGASKVDDKVFFPGPRSGYYVASQDWIEKHSYVMDPQCSATTFVRPATNIQYALDKATASGSKVYLLPGVHAITEPAACRCDNLLIEGYDPESETSAPGSTVLSGVGMSSSADGLIKTDGKANPTFRKLTFRDAPRGVHMVNSGSGSFGFYDCVFTNLVNSGSNGAGIYHYRTRGGVISNCVFHSCSAKSGGAIFNALDNGSSQYCTVHDSSFGNNCATTGDGGSIRAAGVELVGCHFKESNNSTSSRGGHVYAECLKAYDCSFSGAGAPSGYGVCIYTGNFSSIIRNCQFVGGTSGGGFGCVHPGKDILIENCVMTNNLYDAAFVFAEGVSGVVVRQCLFADNANGTLAIGHNALVRSENCTVVSATGSISGGNADWSTNVFVNCILQGALANTEKYYNVLSNCCVTVVPSGAYDSNVFKFNPRFVNAEHGDYAPAGNSLCRDRALKLEWMTNDSLDIAGRPRLVNRCGIPYAVDALPDLGCYEIQVAAPGLILVVK